MKYFKTYEDYNNDDYGLHIPSTELDNDIEYYHGTVHEYVDYELIHKFNIGSWSDHHAIWVTFDEVIANEFSEYALESSDDRLEKVFQVMYKLKIKTNHTALLLDTHILDELEDLFLKEKDLRNYIPNLIDMEFDSWKTNGSIGYHYYDDIAIFDDDLIEVISGKIKFNQNDEWSEYMNLEEIQESIETKKP